MGLADILFLSRDKISSRYLGIVEAVLMLILFGCVIFLLTWPPGDPWKLGASLAVILLGFSYGFYRGYRNDGRLWVVVSALTAGFWVYTLFRYLGFVRWPLGYPSSLSGYFSMFLSHLALVICPLAALLWISDKSFLKQTLMWGSWKNLISQRSWGFLLLLAVALGCWIWAFKVVIKTGLGGAGKGGWFLLLALAKAALTGGAEEAGYRGFIQKAAIKRFGVTLGIILQTCLYTVFHMNLGQALFEYSQFMIGVFILGLVFGIVTYRTRGIGWAFVVHTALDVVIEWQNIH